MKAALPIIRPVGNRHSHPALPWVPLVVLMLAVALTSRGAEAPKTFATPEEASAALASAVRAQDLGALRSLFGSALEEISNPDRVQATNEFTAFAAALDEKSRLVRESDRKCVLEVGAGAWPFPIPIVKRNGSWSFDVVAGKEEILNRRIGKNELEALQAVRTYVNAQREYASRDRDGDDVLEYAQRMSSSPSQTDGLYWPPDVNGEISPLGPFFAAARAEGYFGKNPDAEAAPQPFHGYLFKILKRQGKHAPGGAYNYIINGNMIGGFALVAWPADYGNSGIMTFIVNQQGRVYQKDLGEKTAKLVRRMDAYDPDPSWELSRE